MAKYVAWDEPFASVHGEAIRVECRLLLEDAIRYQHFQVLGKFIYANDTDALDDFLAGHGARVVETS